MQLRVIQTGEVLKVPAVTTVEDITQIIEAVDGLFDGSEGAGGRAPAMFYRAVVLESGDVVGGRRGAEDESELVVDLDRGLPKRCLTQVPSMRVANWLSISSESWGVILWLRGWPRVRL
jgi:hypothetical protein